MDDTPLPAVNNLIERAIAIVGTQAELAKRCGTTQQTISRILHGGAVTAFMAHAIERATRGEITRARLRPDLFGPLPPLPEDPQQPAA